MRAADFWDELMGGESLAWGDAPSPSVEWLASRCPAPARVLVPGCGYGRNALALARLGYEVVATDISARGLARARETFAHPSIAYRDEDAFAATGPFDAILAHYVVHLFLAPERARLLNVWRDALRPGGLLVLTALSTLCPFVGRGEEIEPRTWSNPGWLPIHFETPASLAAALDGQGFRKIQTEERLEPEHKPGGYVETPTVYAAGRRESVRGLRAQDE